MVKLLLLTSLIFSCSHLSDNDSETFFEKPEIDGVRLAFCDESGETCGDPVANAFCRKAGFAMSRTWLIDEYVKQAKVLDGYLCEENKCDGFRMISCVNPLPEKDTKDEEYSFNDRCSCTDVNFSTL